MAEDTSTAQAPIYDTSGLSYPSEAIDAAATDSSTNQYGIDRVVFLINVSESSKGAKDASYGAMTSIPNEDLIKVSGTDAQKAGNANALIKDLTKTGMKRLTNAISLYMPNSVRTGYSVSWSEESEDSMMNGAVASAVANSAADSNSILGAVGAVAGVAGGVLGRTVLKNNPFLQKASRMTSGNSKAEMLFRQVNFRRFEFNYSFNPKSEAEAKNVLSIIRTFRHHMLPEFKNVAGSDLGQFLYIYPSEFNIKYYRNTEINKFIEKQLTAVLTDMSVDYTPNGQWITFANGMPQQINMNLQFMELGVATKEISPFNDHGV